MLHVYVFRLASSSLIVIVPAAGAGTLFAKRTVLRRRKTYRPRIFVKLPSSRESEIVLTRTRGRLEVVDNKNAGSMHSFRVALLASMLRRVGTVPSGPGERDLVNNDSGANRTHEKIARLACQLWEQRGLSFGSPEVSWFRAKDEVRRGESPNSFPFSSSPMGSEPL